MKKKILASILSAGMLVSLMAGCGSNAAETGNEAQSGGTEKSSDSEKQSTKVDNADDAIQDKKWIARDTKIIEMLQNSR